MGATVTTGKLAAAFKATSGKTIYVLFEEAYEKNCYPHTPKWGCFYIGEIDMAMKRIFLHASSCEGGMLQNRGGLITPEGYIAAWLKELAAPMEFANRNLELSVGTGIYAAIGVDRMEEVEVAFAEFGRADIAAALAAGNRITLSLYENAEIFAALYGGRTAMAPWRVIQSYSAPTNGARCAELGYAPAASKSVEIQLPDFLKVDGENRLIRRNDGSWYCAGWEYSIVATYICNLWQSELCEPGSFKKRIKAFRDAIQSAPPIPEGTKVAVDRTIPLQDHYMKKAVDEFAATYPVTITSNGYEMDVIADETFLWKATHLPEACTSWIVPGAAAQPAGHQLVLLTA